MSCSGKWFHLLGSVGGLNWTCLLSVGVVMNGLANTRLRVLRVLLLNTGRRVVVAGLLVGVVGGGVRGVARGILIPLVYDMLLMLLMLNLLWLGILSVVLRPLNPIRRL